MTDLPPGWASASLADICEINPRVDKSAFEPRMIVSFVPMSAVEAETGKVDVSEEREFSQVRQGYTPFVKSDILFAKITPCMENGKVAIVPDLLGDTGFGSTEFHVLRPRTGIEPRFVYHVVSSKTFRYHAEHNMTGAVGQKRVPSAVLEEHETGIPPQYEQRHIVEKIESMFDDIDKGCAELRTAKASLELYRQSLQKSAFEGRLTADWRTRNADSLEASENLLERIRNERMVRHKEALDDWQEAIKQWRSGEENGKKPAKPRRTPEPDAPMPEQKALMQVLPDCWQWMQIGTFSFVTKLAGFEYTKHVTYTTDGDLPVVKAENAGKFGFKVTDYSMVRREDVSMLKRSQLVGGELLMVFVGAGTGNVATVPSDQRYFLGPNIGMIRAETTDVLSGYVEHFLRSPAGVAIKLSSVKAVAQPSISMGTIRQIPVAIPCPAEQAEIVRLLDAHLETADALDAEIDAALLRANALRQSILKKAFSGQLVPQNPTDEPASVLLERIRAERAAAPKPTRKRKASA